MYFGHTKPIDTLEDNDSLSEYSENHPNQLARFYEWKMLPPFQNQQFGYEHQNEAVMKEKRYKYEQYLDSLSEYH